MDLDSMIAEIIKAETEGKKDILAVANVAAQAIQLYKAGGKHKGKGRSQYGPQWQGRQSWDTP